MNPGGEPVYRHDTKLPLARVTGLEPATSGLTGRRSNQLSYTRSGRAPPLRRGPHRVKHDLRAIARTFRAPQPIFRPPSSPRRPVHQPKPNHQPRQPEHPFTPIET